MQGHPVRLPAHYTLLSSVFQIRSVRRLALASVVALSAPAILTAAISIQGRVVNGTHNRPAANQTVEVLMPRGGMQMVGSTKTDPFGHFSLSLPSLDSNAFYLLQVSYQGVDYHAPVQFSGGEAATTNITIYDSTRKQPPLDVRKARIVLHADGNKVHVQELFGVYNNTNPPRAYVNPQGTFLFHLAAAGSQLQVAVAGKLDMPIPQQPQAGETDGDFYIQYPIQPGLTVVMLNYVADYGGNQFSLEDSVPYPIDYVELNVLPQNLTFNSKMFLRAAGQDPETGGKRFEAVKLASNKLLEGVLEGDAPAAADSADNGDTVKVLPNTMGELTLPLLGCFLLILLWALGVRFFKERTGTKLNPNTQVVQKQLAARLDTLFNSLADLDELFAAGKVAEKNYWKERLELKARIVTVLRKSPPALLESYASRRPQR
jgi:hypothetical protein